MSLFLLLYQSVLDAGISFSLYKTGQLVDHPLVKSWHVVYSLSEP